MKKFNHVILRLGLFYCLFWIPFAFANLDSKCATGLSKANALTGTSRSTSPAPIHDPYDYSWYKGARNEVLENFLNTPIAERSPKLLSALKHGKMHQWDEVITDAGLNLEKKSAPNRSSFFTLNGDPMLQIAQRARANSSAPAWFKLQYPELAEQIEVWRKAYTTPGAENPVPRKIVEEWLRSRPEYARGILVFPHPTLWNRVGEEVVKRNKLDRSGTDAIEAAKEYDIETIAALFDPKLAEDHYGELHQMLIQLSGPHATRLSQEGALTTIAQWVLTQYPELKELIDNPKLPRDRDSLVDRFGGSLGVIPVEWATGDFRQVLLKEKLEPLHSEWGRTTLPRIANFVRGTSVPVQKVKTFRLKDPVTNKNRDLKAGDEVELSFEPGGKLKNELSFLNELNIKGVVHAVIVDQGKVVGVQIKPKVRYAINGEVHDIVETYWLSDFEVRDSKILKSREALEKKINLTSISSPEDSGDLMIKLGMGDFQAPVSVGDILNIETKEDGQKTKNTKMAVTGFERDAEGKITGFRGYTHEFAFNNINEIHRDAEGRPVSIDVDKTDGLEEKSVVLKDKFKEQTIPLKNIVRNGSTGFFFNSYNLIGAQLPQSSKRSLYDYQSEWYRPSSNQVGERVDSQGYRLRIGSPMSSSTVSGRAEQTSVSPGDELFLEINTPGQVSRFRYDRIFVTGIVFEGKNAVGIRGITSPYSKEQTYPFSWINASHSYIETRPQVFKKANTIPGAFAKRVPLQETFSRSKASASFEDLFGYRNTAFGVPVETPKWEGKPTSFESWLEANKLAKREDIKMSWAYWVLDADRSMPIEELRKKYQKLALKFHPEQATGDAETMKVLNEAWETVDQSQN